MRAYGLRPLLEAGFLFGRQRLARLPGEFGDDCELAAQAGQLCARREQACIFPNVVREPAETDRDGLGL